MAICRPCYPTSNRRPTAFAARQGALGIQSNVFESKEAYLSSSGWTSARSAPGRRRRQQGFGRQLRDNRRAAGHSEPSSPRRASMAPAPASPMRGTAALPSAAGSTIGLEGGGSASVAVDGTMGIYDLASAINGVSGQSGVAASVLQVSAADYRLVLTGKETGKAITLDDGGSGAADLMGLQEIQTAAKARLTVDGVDVERDSNDITDLMPGVTVSLYQADPRHLGHHRCPAVADRHQDPDPGLRRRLQRPPRFCREAVGGRFERSGRPGCRPVRGPDAAHAEPDAWAESSGDRRWACRAT